MPASPLPPILCPETGIQYRWLVPGGALAEPEAPWAVFFLNGIGLDLGGFDDAIQSFGRPWVSARYPYRHGLHVNLTVPGFEDAGPAAPGEPLGMAEQSRRVAAFMLAFLAGHPAAKVALYGFSFGSDLAVGVLEALAGRLALDRVVLTEINVDAHSCFISQRIALAYARATGSDRGKMAYSSFVSQVVKAHAEGRLSASLMEDMALYFRDIARKDWRQLAHSAQEVTSHPEARLTRLLALSGATPGTRFELVFSDPLDLRVCQGRISAWEGARGDLHLFDATSHEHFHHARPAGVLENLSGHLNEAQISYPREA